MDGDLTDEELRESIQLVPVNGRPNVYKLRFKKPPRSAEGEMTEADWDKFEKDIHDAFEQIS